MRPVAILAAGTLLLASQGAGVRASASAPEPFATATVHLEQNVTDGDVEVVFEVKGGNEGLAKLTVHSPNGRAVIDFAAPDVSALGMRQFRLESPEPKQPQAVLAAYPPGTYRFTGATAAGVVLRGEATLVHALPAAPTLRRPGGGARDVVAARLEIVWAAAKQPAGYIVYVEEADRPIGITARLPGSATSFVVPEGILAPGTEYQLGLGSVAQSGNVSFIETTFTTAAKSTAAGPARGSVNAGR